MKTLFVSLLLPTVALTAASFFSSQPALGQSGSGSSPNPTTQQQPMPPDQEAQTTPAATETTFSGKIVKSGGKLVLTDAGNNTTYQLDDQQKAREFLNKTVKVTGVLDATTGTIRVSAIGPA
jgi:hypothetical protein